MRSTFSGMRWDILAIAGCMIIAFILRVFPVFSGTLIPGQYMPSEPDVLYHLRQVEIMVHHFPGYPWFDPMTYYPTGTMIQWGPLFSSLGAIASLLTGAEDRSAIMATVSWLPPLLFCMVIPVIYGIGRVIRGRMCGIVAAVCMSIMPGMIFYRSYFGFFDHHIAEVLTTSAFILFYLIALKRSEDPRHTISSLIIPSCAAGVCYAAAVLTIPVVCIYALITVIFTFFLILHALLHHDTRKISDLSIINIGGFLPAVFALTGIGIHFPEWYLNGYSVLQPVMYMGICMVTPTVLLFRRLLRNYSIRTTFTVISGIIVAIALLCTMYPPITYAPVYHLRQLLLVSDLQSTVSESGPWNLVDAAVTYQGGILLVIAGMVILIISLRRSFQATNLFLCISALVLTLATIQHWRFEYYLGVIWAVLIAIPLSNAISTLNSVSDSVCRINVKKKNARKSLPGEINILHLFFRSHPLQGILILIGVLFLVGSFSADLSWHPEPFNSDWEEVLTWMAKNTPDPGYNKHQIYNPDEFIQPDTSYGVMSWWGIGHAITEIAGRSPFTNPFQQGTFLSARFLCESDEESAVSLFSIMKGRYIITDTRMISSVFPNIETWNVGGKGILYHLDIKPSGISTLIAPAYYLSLAPRLHIYDGSMADPDEVILATYQPNSHQSDGKTILGSQVNLKRESYQDAIRIQNESRKSGEGILIGQSDISQPTVPISALRHFRLLYESHTMTDSGIKVNGTPARTFSFAKIFEYVPGAVVPGEGIISLTLRTNIGREFTYQQKSINGSFVLPYPTDSCSGEVCPVGVYRIKETNQTIQVNESDIILNY